MSDEHLPLFPLHTVLFPGGVLQLRIFEPRYVDMIGRCMRDTTPFGAVLIREGAEAGPPATPVDVGTMARIDDFTRGEDGLLQVSTTGTRRFRILERTVHRDGLQSADVRTLPEPGETAVPPAHRSMAEALQHAFERLEQPRESGPARFDDAVWLGYRVSELLSLPLAEKQRLLELDDPLERLEQLSTLLAPSPRD